MNIPGDHRLKRYLGDGVYVSHDGYQAWLHAERDGRIHSIALEDATAMQALDIWRHDLDELIRTRHPSDALPEQI